MKTRDADQRPRRARTSCRSRSAAGSVSSAGATLKSSDREADRDREGEDRAAQRESSVSTSSSLVGLLLRGVVRRDRERAEADRERLAERDDAADDRQARRSSAACHRRVDRVGDLRDLAVGLADGDRPVRRAAHHHALEDGLAADRWRSWCGLAALAAAGLLEPALEALDAAAGVHQLLLARVERVAVRADLDVQLGLRRARLERRSRRSSARSRARTRDGCRPSSPEPG